ncbi:MAG: succinate dehydrogenase, hydrophobic membrane anchor protein [Pseudomonadota bacterium]
MVTRAISHSHSGLKDFKIQRFTALVLAIFTFVMTGFFIVHPHPVFAEWAEFMLHPAMRILIVLTAWSLVAHAWVGMWTIATDYIKHYKIRTAFLVALVMILAVESIWIIVILWG